MSNVVVKQGKPSAPGTVVDTSKAKVIPPSDEVAAEHAKEAEFMARTHAAATAERDRLKKEQNAKVKAMRSKGSAKPKAAAKGKAKPAAAKPRSTGNGSGSTKRITDEWLSSKKKDVMVKDEVTTAGGAVLAIVGRWTRRAKDGSLTPMVTGRIVSGAPDGKKKGDRLNAAAKDCTHVAKK
jgi:hypothetical protein